MRKEILVPFRMYLAPKTKKVLQNLLRKNREYTSVASIIRIAIDEFIDRQEKK